MKFNKYLFTLLLCSAVKIASAQGGLFQTTAAGLPVQERNLADVKGSPYFNDSWSKGTVLLKNNASYNNLDLKYSDYDDAVYYKAKNDVMMAFAVPVTDFTISVDKDNTPTLLRFKNGFNITGYDANAYFEVFNEGKTLFLKKTRKKIEENTVYGSSSVDKNFVITTKYFILKDGKSEIVNKDKKSIMHALGDKQTELEAYIKANNINFKNEEDIGKLVGYYNTI